MSAELLLNGDFETDLDHWHPGGSAAQWLDSHCNIFFSGFVYQVPTLEVGMGYRLRFQFWANDDTEPACGIRFAFGNQYEDISANSFIPVTVERNYVCTQDDIDSGVGIYFSLPVADTFIDNVSLIANDNLYVQVVQMVGAETGEVQTINAGKSDDGTPIYFELQTQEIEFGNRAHFKKISDKITVLNQFGIDTAFQVKENKGDFKDIQVDLNDHVNIGQKVDLGGNYFTFKWFGEASETSPILEGIYVEKVEDMGITKG